MFHSFYIQLLRVVLFTLLHDLGANAVRAAVRAVSLTTLVMFLILSCTKSAESYGAMLAFGLHAFVHPQTPVFGPATARRRDGSRSEGRGDAAGRGKPVVNFFCLVPLFHSLHLSAAAVRAQQESSSSTAPTGPWGHPSIATSPLSVLPSERGRTRNHNDNSAYLRLQPKARGAKW